MKALPWMHVKCSTRSFTILISSFRAYSTLSSECVQQRELALFRFSLSSLCTFILFFLPSKSQNAYCDFEAVCVRLKLTRFKMRLIWKNFLFAAHANWMRRRALHALEFFSSAFLPFVYSRARISRLGKNFHFQEKRWHIILACVAVLCYEPTIKMQIEIWIENDVLIYKHLLSAGKRERVHTEVSNCSINYKSVAEIIAWLFSEFCNNATWIIDGSRRERIECTASNAIVSMSIKLLFNSIWLQLPGQFILPELIRTHTHTAICWRIAVAMQCANSVQSAVANWIIKRVRNECISWQFYEINRKL